MDKYWDDIGDPRVNDWMLINGGIWKILAIMTTYLVLTRICLPQFMKNRSKHSKSIKLLIIRETLG
jgi:hypothetical protein